jgi:hypothetical protein
MHIKLWPASAPENINILVKYIVQDRRLIKALMAAIYETLIIGIWLISVLHGERLCIQYGSSSQTRLATQIIHCLLSIKFNELHTNNKNR